MCKTAEGEQEEPQAMQGGQTWENLVPARDTEQGAICFGQTAGLCPILTCFPHLPQLVLQQVALPQPVMNFHARDSEEL